MEMAAAERDGRGINGRMARPRGGFSDQNKLLGLNTSPTCTAILQSAVREASFGSDIPGVR
jgi:hypothetical protein